jgi:AcrR family transcriptional regulator
MAPRAYNNDSRMAQQQALKDRIAAAAAELHAEKGAVATSYAEIAERAGVSLPTVYKHFPGLDELIVACTGHVAGQAPAWPAEAVLGAASLGDAAALLVEAMDRLNAHFEPWMAWNESRLIPALEQMAERERKQLTHFIGQLLAQHRAAGDLHELAALWESVLAFPHWHRLVRSHRLTRTATRRAQLQLLLAGTGPQPAATSTKRPTSRK